MAVKNPTPSYHKATMLLKEGRLSKAFTFLRSICHILPAARSISQQAVQLLEDYHRLKDFYCQGGDDPQRDALLDRIYEQAWQLCELVYDVELPVSGQAPDIQSSLDALLADPYDDLRLNTAFEGVVECRHLTRSQRTALNQALLDEHLPEYVRATLLGAITLHLMQWFDADLVESLYVFTLDDQPVQLQAEAWVTLVIVALIHHERIAHLPRLKEQYRFMCESEPTLLADLQIVLLQCREAISATQRLNDMIKNSEVDEDEKTARINATEFLKIISEGTDLQYKTFEGQAKFPFFSQSASRHHWFEPFALEQPLVKQLLDEHPKAFPWVKMLMSSAAQCETDKYATILMMLAIAGGKLINAIGEKLEQTGLKLDDISPLPFDMVLRGYLHDLYRYCHLHPQASQLRTKLFEGNLKLCMIPWLEDVTASTDYLDKLAKLMECKQRWTDVIDMLNLRLKHKVDEEGLQQLAYAYYKESESSKNTHYAIMEQTLRRCNMLYPGNKWTLRFLSESLHLQGNYTAEEQVLHEAIATLTDDATLYRRLGRCLNRQHRAKEALEPLFKADLLKEGQRQTQVQLAWALLATGDTSRARAYAAKALKHANAGDDEHIIAGHIAMAEGNIQQAIQSYKQVTARTVKAAICRDRAELQAIGIPSSNIDLLNDIFD